jgi:hypothetical protein
MRLLFAISLVSFCALFWAVLAAARHLRAKRERRVRPLQQGRLTEIFETGEFREPRSLRLVQNLVQDVVKPRPQQLEESPSASSLREDVHAPQPSAQPVAPRPMILKSAAPVRPAQTIFVERRKGPQSVRPAAVERRADWALYNKDLGDLTDPYTQPLRSATASGSSSLNRS